MPTFIKIKNGIFNDFTIKNKKFIVNPIKEFMTYYGAKYTGQTPQSVANSFLNDIKKTKMSDEIYNILTTNNIKHRTHADTIYQEYFTDGMPNNNAIKKYDLNKAYRYVMEHMDLAIIGCIVNGPGEAREADIGIAGGMPNLMYLDGKPSHKVTGEALVDELEKQVRARIEWIRQHPEEMRRRTIPIKIAG